MKKALKIGLVALMVLALAVAAVGCGGTDDPEETKPKLVVGSNTAYPPFEYVDTDTNEYEGFDMDLIRAIGEEAGYDVVIESYNFSGLVPAVKAGTMDAAISAMTITEERAEEVNFALPYYESGLIVAVQTRNEEINSIEDLEGKKIAVELGTTGALEAKKIPGAVVTDYDTIGEALLELRNGNVDAVLNDAPVTLYYINFGMDDIKVVGDLVTGEFYGIAIPKSKPDLLEDVNNALLALKENGTYAELYMKWFGVEPPDYLPGEQPQE